MDNLVRFERLIGESNLNKVKLQTVVVLGLGGVGGYATESLARSGIGTLVLVDYDVVDVSNLNRQIIATKDTIGEYKTVCFQRRIKTINEECVVKTINEKITKDNIHLLFEENPNYIVDACDFLEAKETLILECIKRKVKFISSMGTGNKMDPSKLKIIDIRKTSYDPIAKKLRKFVVENKINKKIPVVCSTESPRKISSPVGSNAFVPATAGLLCTSYIINDIVGDISDFS